MVSHRHPLPVSIIHMPLDWWSIGGTVLSLIAIGFAMITVLQNGRAVIEVKRQTQAFAQQTNELTRALMRPAVRVSRSQGSIQAIQGVQSSHFWNMDPKNHTFFVALTNIGLGRATNIRFDDVDPGITFYQKGEARFLVSPDDYLVVGFLLDQSLYDPNEGYVTFSVLYQDVLGHKYRYQCKLRYVGASAVPAEEHDDLV